MALALAFKSLCPSRFIFTGCLSVFHFAKLWKPMMFPEKEAFTRRKSLTLRVIVALRSCSIQMEVTLHPPTWRKVKKQGMRSNQLSRV
eukprot:s637_g27.t1